MKTTTLHLNKKVAVIAKPFPILNFRIKAVAIFRCVFTAGYKKAWSFSNNLKAHYFLLFLQSQEARLFLKSVQLWGLPG